MRRQAGSTTSRISTVLLIPTIKQHVFRRLASIQASLPAGMATTTKNGSAPDSTASVAPRHEGIVSLLGSGRTAGFLVEADHVSRGIAEPRGHLGCIRADRLYEFASVGKDGIDGRGHAIDHDVEEQARFRRRRTAD